MYVLDFQKQIAYTFRKIAGVIVVNVYMCTSI